MKKRILSLSLVFTLLLSICVLFAACGEKTPNEGGTQPSAAPANNNVKATVLRASTPTAPEHAWTLGLKKIADDIYERTGGRYGLQTMCEGGGTANVTIIERLG